MIYLLGAIVLLIIMITYHYIKQFTQWNSILGQLLICLLIVIFTLGVIIFPEESFKSAADGIGVWFNVVCPSLLPFFIGSKLLINLGLVSFIGVLLEPVMRPIFNVPGCGSFPFVMSVTSGYPVGSKIVGELYKKKLCNRAEAQRLLAFCSTSGPLFMIGAVSIGMFNMEESGIIIAGSHYLGALTLGLFFRFYRYKDRTPQTPDSHRIKKGFQKLIQSFKVDRKPIGLLLSEAIKDSINTLLLVGGFIVLFSVIIRLMTISGLIGAIAKFASSFLKPLGVDTNLLEPVANGIFEITIGCKIIASSQAEAFQKIIAASSLIAWSGLSIHAQVAAMISGTDLKMSIYILCKMMHGLFSFIYAYLIICLMRSLGMLQSLEVFSPQVPDGIYLPGWLWKLTLSSEAFLCTTTILLCLGLLSMVMCKLAARFNH